MPYVRRRGNQLALVHGVRDPENKKVEQQILFTVYSKAEALEILGRGSKDGADRFENLLRDQFPDLRFDWKKIRSAIEQELTVLPDLYPYQEERLKKRFHERLVEFARELLLADPQHLHAAAGLLQEHAGALHYLSELIDWRLRIGEEAKASEYSTDNPFYWRFTLQGREVPPEAEEFVTGMYENGRLDEAEGAFKLLLDCFPGYADGWNYLGLIAEERGRLDEAIACYEKTVEVGRSLFPKRIAKSSYWTNLDTRPYMRGLRNLALALNRAGRYEDALQICERLEKECGDDQTAASTRAAVYLNRGDWKLAAEEAGKVVGIWPEENLVAAFAHFELAEYEEAIACFLHAAFNRPRAAKMLVEERTPAPKTGIEAEDHNIGVGMWNALQPYLGRSSPTQKLLRRLLHDPRVALRLQEIEALEKRWNEERGSGTRDAFDRLQEMRKFAFAQEKALGMVDLITIDRVELPARRPPPATPGNETVH